MTEIPREKLSHTLEHLYSLDGMLVSALIKIAEDNEGYTNIRFEADYGYDGDCNWTIVGDRYEDDREYAQRLEIIAHVAESKKKAKKTRDQKERAEYQRLKKKFEKA